MKKNYFIAILILIINFASAQIEPTSYRGAFAPAPTAMWTDSWTNFDPQNAVYPTTGYNIPLVITTNTTLFSGNTYLLQGLTYVKNNATLTIQPGVVIRGAAVGAGLVITKGAKIEAVGTASQPIVFTSNKAVGSRNTGDWGGIIILGKGEFNQNNGVSNVEGITASDDTQFGGGATPDTNDNSGTLKYVRIEFGGYEYSPNNEINGLTMGAVGKGTTIDYVQVSHTKDDGFEWFGGSVNCKHLVSYRTLDDDFDTANGYSGSVQFALAIRGPQEADISKSEGFEGDNTSSELTGAATPGTTAIFTNCTLVGPTYRVTLTDGGTLNANHAKAVRLRRGSKLKVFNSIFMDFKEGLHIDGTLCENHALNGDLIFKNNILAGITTTAKYIQVTAPSTITAAGTGGAFNMTTWFTANANENITSSADILTNPYNSTSATIYTGLDYRPASGSIAETGANFTDATFSGLLVNPIASNDPIEYTTYRGAFAPAPAAMWTDNWTNYDPQNTVYPTTGIDLATEITTNTTLTTGNTYFLQGLTYVKNNATLTIQPGVVIRGAATGAGLVITKGAKIEAVGTATMPIVFTSNQPVGSRSNGDWGGIILLGKGEFNQNNGVSNIEGITASDDTQYGGGATPDTNDNSGTLKYVRIEFGGYEYSTNNEINGLTMGAVGNGTTIDYVQVSHTKDDGFEWFGGSVNCKHLVSYRTLDDDFDTANGYSGSVQFALAIRGPQEADVSKSEGFEGDNTSSEATGAATPGTTAIFTNCTLVGPTYRVTLTDGGTLNANHSKAARIRRGSKLRIYNSIFMDFKEGLHIDGTLCENHALNGDLIFKNNILAGITTTAKYIQVTAPSTITAAGTDGAFNMTTWFTANANENITSSADILTNPYNSTSATIYTGLDYRPASGSIALTGSNFNGIISNSAPAVVSPVNVCKGTTVSLPSFVTMANNAVSLKWYASPTTTTSLSGAPTVTATKTYYVSQVYSDNSESDRTALAVIVNNLPATPGTISGSTAINTSVGTSTEFTYSIAEVTGASSYLWTVPSGVTIVSGQGTTSLVVKFNNVQAGAGTLGTIQVQSLNEAECLSKPKFITLKTALPKAPAAIKVTDDLLPVPSSGVATSVKSFAPYMGTETVLNLIATPSAEATSYVWELPTGVNVVNSTATTTNGVTSSTSNEIEVNFLGVTNENSLVESANIIRIGVKAKNGVGLSVSDNTSLTDPTTTSTAKLTTLTATIPAAPAAIKMTDEAVDSDVIIKDASKYVGTSTVLTLTATPSKLASSYSWDLPTGVTQLSGGTTNVITVDFSGVTIPAGSSSLTIGVKAVNGIGSSITVNAAPNDSSTAKLLILKAAIPAKVTKVFKSNSTAILASAVSEQITISETSTERVYDISPSATANSYRITPPQGCSVNEAEIDEVVEITSLSFTITYPANYISTGNTAKVLKVAAKNGVGTSGDLIYKIFSTTVPYSERIAQEESSVSLISNTDLYPNPANDVVTISITTSADGIVDMAIYSFDGNVVSSSKGLKVVSGVNSFTKDVSKLNKGIYLVRISNSTSNEVITKKLIKN